MLLDWLAAEGSPVPLGATWVENDPSLELRPVFQACRERHAAALRGCGLRHSRLDLPFDYLRNKSGRIWHCRVAEADLRGARFYAYAIAGPTRRAVSSGTALTRTRSCWILMRSRSSSRRPLIGRPPLVPGQTPARRRWACSPVVATRSTGATTDGPGTSRTLSSTSCTFGGSRTTPTPA